MRLTDKQLEREMGKYNKKEERAERVKGEEKREKNKGRERSRAEGSRGD